MNVWIATLACVLGTLWAKGRAPRPVEGALKAAASTGFLVVGARAGLWDDAAGQAVLVGLGLSWVGDVCLVSSDKRWFLAGLVAFLLGHVAYVVGFGLRGVDPTVTAIALVVLVGPAAIVWRWLRVRAGRLGGPVLAYIVVITTMLAAAVGTTAVSPSVGLLAGAALFYVSDLFVARERFVTKTPVNRWIGLPVYYLGQLLLATYGASG